MEPLEPKLTEMNQNINPDEVADGGEVIKPDRIIDPKGPIVIILILAIIFVFAIGLAMTYLAVSNRQKTPPPPPPPPTEEVITPPIPRSPGKFASDAAALKLRSDTEAFVSEVDNLDLLEPQLGIPSIDLGININQ